LLSHSAAGKGYQYIPFLFGLQPVRLSLETLFEISAYLIIGHNIGTRVQRVIAAPILVNMLPDRRRKACDIGTSRFNTQGTFKFMDGEERTRYSLRGRKIHPIIVSERARIADALMALRVWIGKSYVVDSNIIGSVVVPHFVMSLRAEFENQKLKGEVPPFKPEIQVLNSK
jgi:hypothetical protein